MVHTTHQRPVAPGPDGELGESHPGHQHFGQFSGPKAAEVRSELLRQRMAQSSAVHRGGDALHPGRTADQRLGEEVRQ